MSQALYAEGALGASLVSFCSYMRQEGNFNLAYSDGISWVWAFTFLHGFYEVPTMDELADFTYAPFAMQNFDGTLPEALKHFDSDAYISLNKDLKPKHGANANASLDHFKTTGYLEGRRYFLWPFEKVDFPITLTDPTTASGQVVLLNGHLLSTGGSNFTKVGFVISSEGLLPRYDLGWEVHQSALDSQSSFSLAYQPMKFDTTYYYRSYAENEAGRWFGSVKKFNSVQGKTKLTSLYEESRALGNGWYESPWFGILNLPTHGWSYHYGLGWIYLPEGNEEGNWMWSDQRKGWIWTRSDIWPHFWEHNRASWAYFKKTENKTHFFNFSSNSYD
jgi:hypothetical protein